MSPAKKYHIIWGLFAFLSIISFFHINSAIGDKYKINTVFLIAGIVFALLGAIFLIKVIRNSNGGTPQRK